MVWLLLLRAFGANPRVCVFFFLRVCVAVLCVSYIFWEEMCSVHCFCASGGGRCSIGGFLLVQT